MANIRTARRSGFVLRGGREVRETLWNDVTSTATIISGPQGVALLNVTGALLLGLRPFTVVRVRGVIHMESDQTAGAENQAAALGYAVVSDQASAIGITAVPTPITDIASDAWFVYQTMFGSNNATFNNDGSNPMIQFDSKAMRKVEDGSQVNIMLETDVAALTAGVFVRHVARLLIKLH